MKITYPNLIIAITPLFLRSYVGYAEGVAKVTSFPVRVNNAQQCNQWSAALEIHLSIFNHYFTSGFRLMTIENTNSSSVEFKHAL